MGGIAGTWTFDRPPSEEERIALPGGASFSGSGAFLAAVPRSTIASNDTLAVLVAGHFDRAPATGLSAAATLLEAWASTGPDALDSVDGSWVAVVLERASGRLHLARDPFGVRRLFWARWSEGLAFSSRLRPLLAHPRVGRELARENLAEFLSFRYVHAPRTLLRDVQAIPAGHRLVADRDSTRLLPWYRPRHSPPFSAMPDDREALPELERRLNRAVAARASGRESVGVFLSGGLDSSAITLFASKLGPVHCFTVGIVDGDEDEAPYAGRVANVLGARHDVLRVGPSEFLGALDAMVAASDAPVPDPAAIPQALLARAAAQHVDVVLSGDGGDEIFGGRMAGLLAQQFRASAILRHLPGPLRTLAGAIVGGRRPELQQPGVPLGLARLVGGVVAFDRHARERIMRDPGWVRPGIRRTCLEPLYREVVSDPVNEVLHVYLRGRMPEDALARSGAAAAMADLGLRAPLLDRDLVGWCAAQPGPWKVRPTAAGAITKWPLREVLRAVLGRSVVSRPKRVLPGPWRRWFTGPLGPFLDERVAMLRDDRLQVFMPGAVQAIRDRMDEPGMEARLWTLIFLDAWVREIGAT